ncbi:hypothetical protein OG558_21865 [Kribbella sp. NBC_01510]|uniref:hypothetical protein n=1 Tax=Kribbella sp. NBC_01510 TaxID=2903581 RepID=UPI00386DC1C8
MPKHAWPKRSLVGTAARATDGDRRLGVRTCLSPLVDFTCSQWDSASSAAERSYGDLRRYLWTAYAEHRSVPLPSWEQVHLALTTFDVVALSPETKTHYYWQKSAEWQAARRAARETACWRSSSSGRSGTRSAMLGSRFGT